MLLVQFTPIDNVPFVGTVQQFTQWPVKSLQWYVIITILIILILTTLFT